MPGGFGPVITPGSGAGFFGFFRRNAVPIGIATAGYFALRGLFSKRAENCTGPNCGPIGDMPPSQPPQDLFQKMPS